jgi:hypothetical protein
MRLCLARPVPVHGRPSSSSTALSGCPRPQPWPLVFRSPAETRPSSLATSQHPRIFTPSEEPCREELWTAVIVEKLDSMPPEEPPRGGSRDRCHHGGSGLHATVVRKICPRSGSARDKEDDVGAANSRRFGSIPCTRRERMSRRCCWDIQKISGRTESTPR